MGVKLRENIKGSGLKSLYLDITHNGKRHKEYIGLSIKPARTPEERNTNKETKKLAESIRAKKELDLQANEYNYTPTYKKNVDFVAYFQAYIDGYTNKDVRIVKYSKEWFVKFLKIKGIKTIRPTQLTTELCEEYLTFMQTGLNGETPYNYFTKFKRVIKKAVKDKLMRENPAEDIRVVRDEGLKKDILSLAEIQTLAATPNSNPEVKRAFLFSLFSGLRWCDIIELKYSNIDFSSQRLSFSQSKTKHSSKNSLVNMDLSPTLLKLIGEAKGSNESLFNLPSYNGSLDSLKAWVKKAGIKKNISWHCARHSFAVNLLGEVKTDIKTVASLLGHSGLKHTEKYTRAVDELKKKAINGLPEIDF